ncbi:hypothetical protein ACQEVC_43705 [Plantactinospora sp. CA-294935]|uniref:hypothetical protein n=1 Tax=Plantactinospora sp. CA-294935 TaxID=3240012 RepID=UPI003D922067
MRPLLPFARIGVAVALVALTTVAAATPASAEEPDSPYAAAWPSLPFVVNVAQDATKPKPAKLTINNYSQVAARNVSVKIDVSGLPAAITATLPGKDQGCVISGAVATCTLAELAADTVHTYTIGLAPGNLDETPWSGTITATSRGENTQGEGSTESIVQVSAPGIDLAIGQLADVELKAGASTNVPISARNEGTVAADAVAVVISTTHHLELPNPYENCLYSQDDLALTCIVDGAVGPDETFEIDPATPLRLKVADKAAGPDTYGAWAAVLPLTDEEAEQRLSKAEKRSSGKRLRLVPTSRALRAPADDLNYDDNETSFTVKVPLHEADSVAIGATVSGAVDETRSIRVGIRNDGPANTLTPGEEWSSSAEVVLPAGLSVLKVDENCEPNTDNPNGEDRRGVADGLSYHCWPPEQLQSGKTWLFDFTVKIAGEPGAAGSIVVDGGVQDKNTGNNTAPITLETGGAGGGLPVTGARAGLVALGGVLLLAAGVVGVVVARRRRIVTVVD